MLSIVLLIASGLAACGDEIESAKKDAGSGDLVVVATDKGLEAFDAGSGVLAARARDGIAEPDWSELLETSYEGDRTVVMRVDLPSGDELGRLSVSGRLGPAVASEDLVALATPRAPGSTPWLPDGRATTRIAIASLSGALPTATVDLEGNFEPEAFSTDERTLYLIEYLPALAPERYRVRELSLSSGRVRPIGRLKIAAPGQMQGTGRNQTLSPTGDELYTLYTQQATTGHLPASPEGSGYGFVHVLNLEYGWAHCIDLPEPFGSGSAIASAIAASPDGRSLYVADWTQGIVARVAPERLRVTEWAKLALGRADDSTWAAAARDGTVYLAGNDRIVTLDGATLKVLDRRSVPAEVTGLGLSDDGRRLYVGQSNGVLSLDVATGRTASVFSGTRVSSIVHVD